MASFASKAGTGRQSEGFGNETISAEGLGDPTRRLSMSWFSASVIRTAIAAPAKPPETPKDAPPATMPTKTLIPGISIIPTRMMVAIASNIEMHSCTGRIGLCNSPGMSAVPSSAKYKPRLGSPSTPAFHPSCVPSARELQSSSRFRRVRRSHASMNTATTAVINNPAIMIAHPMWVPSARPCFNQTSRGLCRTPLRLR